MIYSPLARWVSGFPVSGTASDYKPNCRVEGVPQIYITLMLCELTLFIGRAIILLLIHYSYLVPPLRGFFIGFYSLLSFFLSR